MSEEVLVAIYEFWRENRAKDIEEPEQIHAQTTSYYAMTKAGYHMI